MNFHIEDYLDRALSRARSIALALIDERGEVKQDVLKKLISDLETEGYIFYPEGYSDGTITEHILSVLRLLDRDEILKSIKRFQNPLCHKWAEKVVSETLGLPSAPLTDGNIRAAVLCAALTPLRQNVGSCFATAPAILIQREQTSLFLDDLYQLLSTGKLKRTFGGVEYAVPLSPNAGLGKADNALLKCWEFTLASYSEIKMEFSRWNLYQSLGLAPEELGGIGQVIYQKIDEKIKEFNEKIEEYQKQYEVAFDEARAAETLLKRASSEAEARRLQAEYQARAYHLRSCQELRDEVYTKGSNFSNLFSFLIKQYDQKFPEYFQEIYDAKMQGFQGEMYADSPAGFRLVYKHGRADPSAWSLIYNEEEYISSLVDFFKMTESSIAAECSWEEGGHEVMLITSAIIAHVRTPKFLESALQRAAKAHSTLGLKKPWAYTSGGTMTTLLKTYFRRENELTVEEKWVESESELLIFLLDTLKHLPPKVTDPFLKDQRKTMLIASPTHAFLLLPGQEFFRDGWQEEIFTYTWVRDNVFLPSLHFYDNIRLSKQEQIFLLEKFSDSHLLHRGFHPSDKKLTISEWRKKMLEAGQVQPDAIDSFLYQALPLIPGRESKAIARRILSDLMDEKVEKALQKFTDAPLMTAHELKEAIKSCYLLAQEKITLSFDLHLHVARHARFVGASSPTPILFADTNWTNNFFGFVVNPGTGKFELWRLDRTLSQGVPMREWKHWLNGTDRKSWVVYTRPQEYQYY